MCATILQADLAHYHGIFAFLRHELLLVSVPQTLLGAFRHHAVTWAQTDVLQEDRLRYLIGYPFALIPR
jgi:hypothetical protein